MKFLEASRLNSNKTSVLLNLLWCCWWRHECLGVLVSSKISSKMCLGVWKCFRKASIYMSLEVGERHVAEFDWWHISQPDWRSFKTFPPRHMVSFNWPKCLNFQGDICQHPIGLLMSLLTCVNVWLTFCMLFYVFILMTLGKFLLFLNGDGRN